MGVWCTVSDQNRGWPRRGPTRSRNGSYEMRNGTLIDTTKVDRCGELHRTSYLTRTNFWYEVPPDAALGLMLVISSPTILKVRLSVVPARLG